LLDATERGSDSLEIIRREPGLRQHFEMALMHFR